MKETEDFSQHHTVETPAGRTFGYWSTGSPRIELPTLLREYEADDAHPTFVGFESWLGKKHGLSRLFEFKEFNRRYDESTEWPLRARSTRFYRVRATGYDARDQFRFEKLSGFLGEARPLDSGYFLRVDHFDDDDVRRMLEPVFGSGKLEIEVL